MVVKSLHFKSLAKQYLKKKLRNDNYKKKCCPNENEKKTLMGLIPLLGNEIVHILRIQLSQTFTDFLKTGFKMLS